MYFLISAIPWRQFGVVLFIAFERVSASTSASSSSTIFTNTSTSSSSIGTKSSILTVTTTSILDTKSSTTSSGQSGSSLPKPALLNADSSPTFSLSSSVSHSGTGKDATLSDTSIGAPDSATSAHHAPASGPSTPVTSSSIATNSGNLVPTTNSLLDLSTPTTSVTYSTESYHGAPGDGSIASPTHSSMYTNSSISVQISTASSSTPWTNASCTSTSPHYNPTTCDPNYDPWIDISNFNVTLQHIWFCSANGQQSVSSIYNDMQVSLGLLNVQLLQIGAINTVFATQTNSDLTYSRYSSLFTSRENILSTLWGTNGDAVYTLGDAVSDSCQYTVCSRQLQLQRSQWYAGNTDVFVYSAKKPCCGYCTVAGAAVQVAYWPTPAQTPPVTVLVDSNNNTYYSPYVYATFIDFSTHDDCGQASVFYPAITGTFADGYLMTSQYPTDASQYLTANFEDWTTINFRDFGPQCVCTPPNCASDSVLGWQTNLCTPELSIPTDLLQYIPAWRTCTAQFDGVFDPPIALQTVGGLFTTPSTPQAQATPVPSPAAPGNSPTTPGPPPTPAPSPPASPPPTPQPQNQPNSSPSPAFNGNSSPNTNIPSSIVSTSGLPSIYFPPTTRQGVLSQVLNGQTTTTSNAQNSPINSPNVSPSSGPIPIPEAQTLTTNPQGNVVIGTQTASLNTDGNLVIGTQTITPDTNGDFVVTGIQTITESGGQIVTISGETLSVETATVGSTKAVGAIIASFMGVAPPTTTSSVSSTGAPAQYTGAAVRFEGLSEGSLLVSGVLVLMVWL